MVLWEELKTGLLLSSSVVVIVLRGNLFFGVTLCVWGNFCVSGGTPPPDPVFSLYDSNNYTHKYKIMHG